MPAVWNYRSYRLQPGCNNGLFLPRLKLQHVACTQIARTAMRGALRTEIDGTKCTEVRVRLPVRQEDTEQPESKAEVATQSFSRGRGGMGSQLDSGVQPLS